MWIMSYIAIYVGLFLYMFTFWGSHGLGDSARVPIAHWREIHELNCTQAYIQSDKHVSIVLIDKFFVTDDFVYGLLTKDNENYDGLFFVYDLTSNTINTFKQEHLYVNYLKANRLELNIEYKDFDYYYSQHWHGWRFWILP